GSPGSRARCFRTCSGSLTARSPAASRDVDATSIAFRRLLPRRRSGGSYFRGSVPGPHVPLSTLRRRPCEWLRMTRGRCGSLLLHRMTLSFTTPCRFDRRTGETTMFVITGATGHVGSVAAETLLAAGHQVRVVVRDAAKAARSRALGAEVFVADLTDQAALARAVRGARGVFLLSPPDIAARNFVADRKRLTQRQVDTLTDANVPHVVLLSSVGAQHASGTGPIVSVHNAEAQLRASGLAATFVRAGYFVENWGAVLSAVKSDG